ELCGGNVYGNPGNLSSPAYPNHYPHGSDCKWNIHVSGASRIRITFHVFEVESNYDYLYIGEGGTVETGLQVFQLTGSEIPKEIILNGEEGWAWFTSDNTRSFNGFFFTYEAFTDEYVPGKFCSDEDMVLKPGSTLYIQSPNYPGDYYSNSECLWK
ncbi:tolloid-like protein 2, partial [Saccoglossus kowalevskii]